MSNLKRKKKKMKTYTKEEVLEMTGVDVPVNQGQRGADWENGFNHAQKLMRDRVNGVDE